MKTTLLAGAALAAITLAALPAAAQGIAEPLRGAWFQGDCSAPRAMLHVTARSAAQVPAEGAARLQRFARIRAVGDWTILQPAGADAPRTALRAAAGGALELTEPEAKTRDDRLPGGAPVQRWQRCASVPPAIAARHGEGVAMLGGLEALEAGCATAANCTVALLRIGDVSRDGLLSTAELARVLRGLLWVQAVQDGADATTLGHDAAGRALMSARAIVAGHDYDNDGKLSPTELAQDGIAFGAATGTAEGSPAAIATLLPGFARLVERRR